MATHSFPELLPPRWVLPGARLGSYGAWRKPAARPRAVAACRCERRAFPELSLQAFRRAPAKCAAEEKRPLVSRKHVFGSDLV